MTEGEIIQELHTRFTTMINEIYSLGKIIPNEKAVRKHLSVLPESWESKVEVITEAHDQDKLAMDEIIGNLMTYELKKKQEKEIGGKRKENNLVPTGTTPENFEDESIALMTKRFSRMLKKGQVFHRRNSQKITENPIDQVCHKCGNLDHFVKFCPLKALEKKRNSLEKWKEIKNDKYIPTNSRMTNQEADLSMKRAFASVGDLSEEEFEDGRFENQSLLAMQKSNKYDFMALTAETDSEDDEEDDKQSKMIHGFGTKDCHLNFHGLKLLKKMDMVQGLPEIPTEVDTCESCIMGKQHRKSFPKGAFWRASSEAFATFKKFKSLVEKQKGCSIKTIRSDRGGIQKQLTAGYTHQQNGVYERRNRTIVEMDRTMMNEKGLPKYFWAEPDHTTVHILNRCPTKALKEKTPVESGSGIKPFEGDVQKHKPRLVARGFTQKPCIDFYGTLSPVARLEIIRTVIVVAAQKIWKIFQLDVK
ncbi:uncharacterized protein [Solanum lycopersicum]|uniref:uncharacterized protein n=1 Tax=Solanum lycopersicum TaxID=4081 RepID=UPI003748F2BE